MALRNIENSLLPISQERPKKLPKLSKQPEIRPKDSENDPMPPPSDSAIDYVASGNLKPLTDPESTVKTLLEDLSSKDWIKVCESLNNTRRLAIYHSSLLLPILEKLIVVMVKAMKNPRSALCKTSIMACSDLFNAFGQKLLEESRFKSIDDLLLQLLMKASQDKKFVCEEAEKTLNTMVKSVPSVLLLRKLIAYVRHSNPRVRAKAAVSTSNCVSEMEVCEMEEFGYVEIAQMVADLLSDKLPEAREAARSMVNSVYDKFKWNEEEEEVSKQEAWQKFCEENVKGLNAQAMIKIASSQ